jgi:hypothetical protein
MCLSLIRKSLVPLWFLSFFLTFYHFASFCLFTTSRDYLQDEVFLGYGSDGPLLPDVAPVVMLWCSVGRLRTWSLAGSA